MVATDDISTLCSTEQFLAISLPDIYTLQPIHKKELRLARNRSVSAAPTYQGRVCVAALGCAEKETATAWLSMLLYRGSLYPPVVIMYSPKGPTAPTVPPFIFKD